MSAVITGNADSGIVWYISLERYTKMLQYVCMCDIKQESFKTTF